MKMNTIIESSLAVILSAMALQVSAQGVVVKKTDGTRYKVSYADLDCIETYTAEDEAASNALVQAFATGGTYTVEADVTLDEPLVLKAGTVLELNLNGKKIINQLGNASTDVIIVEEGATLTINGEGNVEAVSGNDGFTVISKGEVTINGGTFTSGTDAENKTNACIYASGNGKVYITGGEFHSAEGALMINKKDADRATTVIEITGGSFYGFNPADNGSETSGGGRGTGTNFVVEGYNVVENNDVFTVVDYVYTFAQLRAAISAASAGDEIKVGGKIEMESTLSFTDLTFKGVNATAEFVFPDDKFFSLTNAAFNDMTLSRTTVNNYQGFKGSKKIVYSNCTLNGFFMTYETEAEFNECKFNIDNPDAYNMQVYGAGKSTFNTCTFNSAGKSVLVYSEDNANTVKFNGCTFTASSPVEGKAAIEVDGSLLKENYLVYVDDCTASGFGEGNVTGNQLFNVKRGDSGSLVYVDGVGEIYLNATYITASAATATANLTKVCAALVEDLPANIYLGAGEFTGECVEIRRDVTIQPMSGLTKDDVTFNGQLFFNGSSKSTVKDLTLTNAGTINPHISAGNDVTVFMWTTVDVTIEDCVFNQDAKKSNGSAVKDWWATGNLNVNLKNCVFNCNSQRALQLHESATIDGCVFNEPYRYALQVNSDSERTITMKNCTINKQIDNSKPAYFIQLTSGGSEAVEKTANRTFIVENNKFGTIAEGITTIKYVAETGCWDSTTVTISGEEDAEFMEIQ